MDAFSTAFGAAFRPAAKAAGMTVVATITSNGITDDYDVGFVQPDQLRMDGMTISREYEIEMLDPDDCPTLAEDDQVVIAGVSYRVREMPRNFDQGADGYFRRAVLTKV